eukprot:m.254260 g.254260  ORF g.254260 m.254260 type:complete len:451 (-) comp19603_c0_seq8:5088-6440(-)
MTSRRGLMDDDYDVIALADEARRAADAEIAKLLARDSGCSRALDASDDYYRSHSDRFTGSTYHGFRQVSPERPAAHAKQIEHELNRAHSRAEEAEAELRLLRHKLADRSSPSRASSSSAAMCERHSSTWRREDHVPHSPYRKTNASIMRARKSMTSEAPLYAEPLPAASSGGGERQVSDESSGDGTASARWTSMSPSRSSSVAHSTHPAHSQDAYELVDDAHRVVGRHHRRSVDLLESENVRLVEARSAVELDRDKLRIEVLRLKSDINDLKQNFDTEKKTHQIDCDAKDRLSQRLLGELQEAREELEAVRGKQRKLSEQFDQLQSQHSSLVDEFETEQAANRKLRRGIEDLRSDKEALTSKVSHHKDLKNQQATQYNRLVEVLAEMQSAVKAAKKLSDDCAARGYFASKARKLHDTFAALQELLLDVATAMDRGQSRRQTIDRIEKLTV